ncbi:Outer membrane usher protein LpfC, partial [Dissostichus eleginoides]
ISTPGNISPPVVTPEAERQIDEEIFTLDDSFEMEDDAEDLDFVLQTETESESDSECDPSDEHPTKSCQGNVEILKEKWDSILYHTANIHVWNDKKLFHACEHPPLGEEDRREDEVSLSWDRSLTVQHFVPRAVALQEVKVTKEDTEGLKSIKAVCREKTWICVNSVTSGESKTC